MSYRLAVLSDLPTAFWPLDETTGTTLADISGMGYTQTLTATVPALGRTGLVSGMRAIHVEGAERSSASIPGLFQAGREDQPFALELWIKFDAPPTATRLPLYKTTNMGIYITTTRIEFKAANTAGEVFTAYYPVTDWLEPKYIVANYVGRNLSINVNTEEGTSVDFTGEFNSTSNTWVLGGSTGTTQPAALISAPAIYKKALSPQQIRRHYEYGRLAMRPLDIASALGAAYYSLDDDSASIAHVFEETSREDFEAGTYSNVEIGEGYVDATGTAGTHTSDLEYIGHLSNIAGSRIDWDASIGITVDVSLDQGTTWAACTNHAEVPGLAAGAATTGKFVMFRKNFPATTTTTIRLDRLKLTVYTSKTSSSNLATALGIYGSPTLAESAGSPLDRRTNMGMNFSTTSHASVPVEAGSFNAISFWYKRNSDASGSWQYVFDTRVSGSGAYMGYNTTNVLSIGGIAAFYVNGALVTPTTAHFPLGEWVHVVAVLTAPTTGPIWLNASGGGERGAASIAHLMLHTVAPTAREASVLYGMMVGVVNTSVLETPATIVEVASGIKVYSAAWATASSGTR